MGTVLLGFVAAFFLAMGLCGLLVPDWLVAPFGMKLTGPDARAEVRAVYGGFGVAVAGLLVFAMVDQVLRDGMVLAVAVALLGMAFGRLVSRLADKPSGFYPIWFYFWVELVAAGGLLWIVSQ